MKAIKIFAAALVAVFAISCGSNKSNVKVDAELPSASEVDSVSYLIGINVGSFIKNFADDLNEIDMAQFKKGMNDFLNAEGSPYDPEFGAQFDIDPNQMNQIFNAFVAKKNNYKAAVNAAEGKAFLAKNAKRADVDTTASGLQYTIIAEGSSEKIQLTDTLLVNYKGTLLDGTVFDENDSTSFPLTNVIKGWQEGLTLVGEGAKIKLFVPSNLGYGPRGTGNIKPNSALIFEVEVLKVSKAATSEE